MGRSNSIFICALALLAFVAGGVYIFVTTQAALRTDDSFLHWLAKVDFWIPWLVWCLAILLPGKQAKILAAACFFLLACCMVALGCFGLYTGVAWQPDKWGLFVPLYRATAAGEYWFVEAVYLGLPLFALLQVVAYVKAHSA
jgi:hypothetical protein